MIVRVRNKSGQLIKLLVRDEEKPDRLIELPIYAKDAVVLDSARLGPNFNNLEARGILVTMPVEDTTPPPAPVTDAE